MKRDIQILDGNKAAATVAYEFTDVAFVYPITPATPMAEYTEEFSASNKENLFGNKVSVSQMQSEAGVSGAMHGALASGALASTYTASQGLLLMIPNLYKMAAEHLPGVIYVASRSIATHALSIFGDHSDIYATRQTGACIFSVSNVQEIVDLAPVAHLSAIIGKMPVIFFFDGFRTSHEMQKVEIWSKEDLKDFLPEEAIKAFREQALNPRHPKAMGSAQNPDIYFQAREANNLNYLMMPEVVSIQIDKINDKLGTKYAPYEYYGALDAEHVIIAMGSVVDTIKSTVDYLNSKGEKVGVLNVRLFRPFSTSKLIGALPASVKLISVLDRTKEPGSVGEPLYQDVATALNTSCLHHVELHHGRYGLASKDTTPEQIVSVFANHDKEEFTIGIHDDITNLSLEEVESLSLDTRDCICCKFYGRGSDGTIGSVKAAGKIIGEHTDHFIQVFSEYDSKVSGSLTTSHLRYSKHNILDPYLVNKAHFIVCNHFKDLEKYDLLYDLLDHGSLLLNSSYSIEELSEHLSANAKQYLANHDIHLYTIDADHLCRKIGLGNHINMMIMTAAFCIMDLMDADACASLLKKYVQIAYKNYGSSVLEKNNKAIECARENLKQWEIPTEWSDAKDTNADLSDSSENLSHIENMDSKKYYFLKEIHEPIMTKKGDEIPVSSLLPYSDGSSPSGTSAYDKLGAAGYVAVWNMKECMQCNHCSFVCPHSAIRPYILTKEEVKKAPATIKHCMLTGSSEHEFTIAVSVMDCTGCGSCLSKCPASGKALRMMPLEKAKDQQEIFDYLESLPKKDIASKLFRPTSVKGSQFKKPLLEFPGSCPGCGETPYAKLLTQLFGDRMYIANATGCSSIWGNSTPSMPYTTDQEGHGPAWSNSLFEDAAEFGYGMLLAHSHIRDTLKERLLKLQGTLKDTDPLKGSIENWLDTYTSGSLNSSTSDDLCHQLSSHSSPEAISILQYQDYLSKKSQWIFGGDGWAYDIGFGGLDHILASGKDINILVFDTECYSNTGGQASKSTPQGAIAKLASTGKITSKKDLPSIAMNYKDVYVASISMGADMNQCIKAMVEAESYEGPSLLLAYAPCKHHGLPRGSAGAQYEEEAAVACGYKSLFRYNPSNAKKGLPCMQVDAYGDSKKLDQFLSQEKRYKTENYSDRQHGEELKEHLKDDIIYSSDQLLSHLNKDNYL